MPRELETAIREIASLHSSVKAGDFREECRICMFDYPCRTRQLADLALETMKAEQ